MGVYVCPLCGGRGVVPCGFYMSVQGVAYGSSSLTPEQCRSCCGNGVVFDAARQQVDVPDNDNQQAKDTTTGEPAFDPYNELW